jgi:type I restriction enzyme S subunit
MSKLDELIKLYCPNGIEYYFLSEVVSIKEKGAITKEELSTNGKYPVINSSRDVLGYYDYFNNDSETLVLTSHGAYAGYCHYLKNNFWAGSLCYPMQAKNNNSVSTKFLY